MFAKKFNMLRPKNHELYRDSIIPLSETPRDDNEEQSIYEKEKFIKNTELVEHQYQLEKEHNFKSYQPAVGLEEHYDFKLLPTDKLQSRVYNIEQ